MTDMTQDERDSWLVRRKELMTLLAAYAKIEEAKSNFTDSDAAVSVTNEKYHKETKDDRR